MTCSRRRRKTLPRRKDGLAIGWTTLILLLLRKEKVKGKGSVLCFILNTWRTTKNGWDLVTQKIEIES